MAKNSNDTVAVSSPATASASEGLQTATKGNGKRSNRSSNFKSSRPRTLKETRRASSGFAVPPVMRAPEGKASVRDKQYAVNLQPGFENGFTNWNHITNVVTEADYGAKQGYLEITGGPIARTTAAAGVLWFTPVFGPNAERAMFINPMLNTATALYHKITTRLNNVDYEPYDLAVYAMAVSAAYQLAAEIKRDLKLLNTPLSLNGVYTAGLFDLLGLVDAPEQLEGGRKQYKRSPGSLTAMTTVTRCQYVDTLNQLIDMLNKLGVPASMPLFNVNCDLFDYIYQDSQDPDTSQLYLFASSGYWWYDEDSNFTGARLVYQPWSSNTVGTEGAERPDGKTKSISEMLQALKRCVTLLTSQTVAYNMVRDLVQAFQDDPSYTMDTLQADTILDQRYDPALLIAIENATIVSNVHYGAYVANAEIQNVTGQPLAPFTEQDIVNAVSLPLQFHGTADVSVDEIAAALRFHPFFNYHATFKSYSGGQPVNEEALATEGLCGFAIVNAFEYTIYDNLNRANPSDAWKLNTISIRNQSVWDVTNVLHDFQHAPMVLHADITWEGFSVTGHTKVNVTSYSGVRDVEVTVSLDYLQQWFRGNCETVWGSYTDLGPMRLTR